MKDLQALAVSTMEQLNGINIPYCKKVSFIVNSRAKRRWGQYKELPNGSFEIEISRSLLDDDLDDSGAINTIIHELLHTIDGCLNHGNKWKRYAGIVKNELGYDIKRKNSAEEKGITDKKQMYKFNFKCVDCGNSYYRYKDMKYDVRGCTCGRCHGKLVKIAL